MTDRITDEECECVAAFAEAINDGTFCLDGSPFHADLIRRLLAERAALIRERDGLRTALEHIVTYECCPDTLGRCGCCGLFRGEAGDALSPARDGEGGVV